MPFSDATGPKVYYQVSGEGPAFVFIPANPFDPSALALPGPRNFSFLVPLASSGDIPRFSGPPPTKVGKRSLYPFPGTSRD